MGDIKRMFVPWGDLKPDASLFLNDGLLQAFNVVPVYGSYLPGATWLHSGDEPADEPYGLHAHLSGGSAWSAYLGSITRLYEYNTTTWVRTDKTRAVGGNYATSGAGGEAGWQFASFGDAVIGTQYVDDPQLLTSPAAANFVKLAQSGAGNPGMDPRAKFVVPVRNNLFLANLTLPAAFDTLPIGANPTVVAWSATDNVRQYGSYNVTPQLIGTGYQPISYDFGHINGMIGGDYALVSLQRGWVRADGPPYTFRPIVASAGCRFPNSIVKLNNDVYFWGQAGPSVFRGGEGEAIVLGTGRIARTLVDATTGFSNVYSLYPSVQVRHVSAGVDSINGLVFWSFTSTGQSANRVGDTTLIYNVGEDRFSFVDNVSRSFGPTVTKNGALFLRSGPDLPSLWWAPGRDIIGVVKYTDDVAGVHYQIGRPTYSVPESLSPLLSQAFRQLDANATTRVLRIRPVMSRSNTIAVITVTAQVSSKNNPLDAAVLTDETETDKHGWIVFPNSVYADFHSVQISIVGGNLERLSENDGYEIEYQIGSKYSA